MVGGVGGVEVRAKGSGERRERERVRESRELELEAEVWPPVSSPRLFFRSSVRHASGCFLRCTALF